MNYQLQPRLEQLQLYDLHLQKDNCIHNGTEHLRTTMSSIVTFPFMSYYVMGPASFRYSTCGVYLVTVCVNYILSVLCCLKLNPILSELLLSRHPRYKIRHEIVVLSLSLHYTCLPYNCSEQYILLLTKHFHISKPLMCELGISLTVKAFIALLLICHLLANGIRIITFSLWYFKAHCKNGIVVLTVGG